MRKIVNMKHLEDKPQGEGTEALYFQMTEKIGVKVWFRAHQVCESDKTRDPKVLQNSLLWEHLTSQRRNLNKLAEIGIAPASLGMLIVQDGSRFLPAMIQQHISFYRDLTQGQIEILNNATFALEQCFGSSDLHTENLVICSQTQSLKLLDLGAVSPDAFSEEGFQVWKKVCSDAKRELETLVAANGV